MEASGHARWFERLVAELQFELRIGDAAETAEMKGIAGTSVIRSQRSFNHFETRSKEVASNFCE